ncbi:MAG TPA: hypothetical protein VIK80_15020 [Flavihumibacter sp.]|jgi:hypothetical protein
MTIRIDSKKTIKELQDSFSAHFPFLKIEFFERAHKVEQGSLPKKMIRSTRPLGELNLLKEEGELEISPTMTVASFEQSMIQRFGLAVQVFRKSGNLWLETTMTDQWTLGQQNEHGREISSPGDKSPKNEKPDFELSRDED